MLRRLLLLAMLLPLQACYASTGAEGEEGVVVEPLVMHECVATASPWYDAAAAGAELPGTVRLWANYPLFSPDYSLDSYAVELVVEIDEALDARIDLANPRWETSLPMVLGRMEGDPSWRVQTTPDVSCPPRPEGVEWPVNR